MGYNVEILENWLSKGLCSGAGDGKTSVCLEQAVALCAGLPLTDKPDSCVDPVVSQFGRAMNDKQWSSNKARADGLRVFAFAQLGTAGKLDSLKFARRIAEMFIAEILPAISTAAAACEKDPSVTPYAAYAYAANAAYAYASAAAYADAAYVYAVDNNADAAASSGVYAVDNNAAAAAYAAAYAVDNNAAAAAYAASSAAYAAAYAAACASAPAAPNADDARDEILSDVANIAVRAIKEQLPQIASNGSRR